MVLAFGRYRAVLLAACATLALTLGGCTQANFSSIHRNLDTLDGSGVLTDAKQRAIIVGGVVRDPAFSNEAIFFADGPYDRRLQSNGVDHKFFRPRDTHGRGANLKNAIWHAESARGRIVCAEPSPDALTVLAASAATQVDIAGKGSGSLAGALSEAGGSIGLRTQSIQLLRDELFRICEAYMNGAIGEIDYRLMKRRVQSHVVALLAIEQLTGPITPPALSLGSESSADAGTLIGRLVDQRTALADEIAAEEELLTDTKDGIKKQQQTIDNAESSQNAKNEAESNKQELTSTKRMLETSIESKKKGIVAIDAALADPTSAQAMARATAAITAVQQRQPLNDQSVAAIAKEVGRIASSVLSADYGAQVCLEYARSGALEKSNKKKNKLSEYCDKVMKKYEESTDSAIKRQESSYKFLLDLTDRFKGNDTLSSALVESLVPLRPPLGGMDILTVPLPELRQ